ncbi:uncharacterized protein LOC135218000 [Macrobrachium nipponense]|uniref:uncharacterized protein LOC135218000 n=1 Tax=Macrobrachium nipponense TaxID=159736 RepID=UPI0030C82C32
MEETQAEIPGFIVMDATMVVMVSAMGYTADSLQKQASAGIGILTDQERMQLNGREAAVDPLWTEDPLKMAIYKLCSQPLSFDVCGIFVISPSFIISVLNSVVSYLVITLQFQLLERQPKTEATTAPSVAADPIE